MKSITRRQALALACASAASAIPLEKFPLAITTDEIDEDVRAAAKFLKDFRLTRAEVRNIWGKYNTAQPIERVREARAIFDEYGVKVVVLGTGVFKVPLPRTQAETDQQWRLLDQAFERAAVLGASTMRIFAFMTDPTTTPDAAFPRVFSLLAEAGKRARQHKVRLAVENVGGSFVLSSDQAATLLRGVKDPAIGLTWDPNNAAHAEERPFPDGYRKLDVRRIYNVHLRDYRRVAGKAEWKAVGEGEFDNLGQIKALLRDGYTGGFTLETHWKSPQGKAHATRVSMEGLLKVVAKV
jgi:sugar phosphate isomerase/epimerase